MDVCIHPPLLMLAEPAGVFHALHILTFMRKLLSIKRTSTAMLCTCSTTSHAQSPSNSYCHWPITTGQPGDILIVVSLSCKQRRPENYSRVGLAHGRHTVNRVFSPLRWASPRSTSTSAHSRCADFKHRLPVALRRGLPGYARRSRASCTDKV